MSYNLVVIISVVICAILSLLVSYYGVLLILNENSSLFKMAQLIVAIVIMTTFYAPIKHLILKYTDIKEEENQND
jgi:ABC-type bacteriocin/lantibiotic exporter with double-glycine peptidase domain